MSRYIWEAVHAATCGSWLTLLVKMGYEIVTHGNLVKEASAAGPYNTADALFLLAIFGLSFVSAARALWKEVDNG